MLKSESVDNVSKWRPPTSWLLSPDVVGRHSRKQIFSGGKVNIYHGGNIYGGSNQILSPVRPVQLVVPVPTDDETGEEGVTIDTIVTLHHVDTHQHHQHHRDCR